MRRLHNALQLKQLALLKQMGYRYTDVKPSDLDPEPAQLPDDLEELRRLVEQCHLCDLAKSRHKVVFGEGDPHARLMFVGEGPGATEDQTGRPFVGRAGELLTRMIENVLHLRREEVYIANIVKCRPPGNRVPTPTEAFTCRPYLLKQIEIIRPRIIMTLGATAYRYLTNDETPISRVRGHIIQSDHYTLVPTFHPSYLLRNPSAKKQAWEDLLKVKALLEKK
ncbi:uracil-DNA glycosylase [Nitratifractor salsuginis]|uniref:Type-4 uracil-DNA glycosylase n=1 Tax=Nitratifractor salsuginis (strain DSM 16511 / JCM 12458 / E9I37-1) TaxID=749222 RepID=E6X025_NITSE|nr:uracil-DNA glycosylase [Nitratifractor salsuginis]ADV46748.1 phage SPO1 DNA polymerase-related protein [Nitratifractor salsuginis DSM 16511]